MTSGAEHYAAAEDLLAVADRERRHLTDSDWIAVAQVHATLALAAATAYEADTGSRLRGYGGH